jgi:predicted RNase H-like nuclease (RuvC/YqgF family)
MENPEQELPIRKDSNKIYFLVAVILALLGTNAYLFFKDQKANDRIVTISDEKTRMQTEIDKIEAELDNASSNNLTLSDQMLKNQAIAREKIDELRSSLKQGQLTQVQLANAQEEIKQLKYFVSKYASEIDDLKMQNKELRSERNELLSTVDSVRLKVNELEKQNDELNTKVQAAAAIKSGNVSISAFNIRGKGKESMVTRANRTDKLRVDFTLVNNSLAQKGLHTIFLRVTDPSGNLVTDKNGGLFISDNEELQYSSKTAIEFANDGRSYTIDWIKEGNYQKGVYTIILHADGYTMGKGSVTLK